MLYLSGKWDTYDEADMDLVGGVQIASQGRYNRPYLLAYSHNAKSNVWNYEIVRFDGNLGDVVEFADSIFKARSNQRAIEVANTDHDPAAADSISVLTDGSALGEKKSIVFKGSHAGTRTHEFMQKFLQSALVEVLNEQVWTR
jgi:hypothetical protein